MKNWNKIIICLLTINLLISGCTDEIDRFPLDTISEQAFFRNEEDFQLFANSFYPSLTEWNLSDNMSDITRGQGPNIVSNGTIMVTENDNTWNGSYDVVRGTNFLLQKFEEFPNQEEVAVYAAEAKFFRAFTYFNLLKTFGGVPLVTTVLDTDSPELNAPRNTRDEVFAQIEIDLLEAIPDLPIQSEIADADFGRVSKGAAQSFLARVYLFEGTWKKFKGDDGSNLLDKAAKAADEVILSDEYQLFQDDFGFGEDEFLHYFFTLDDIQSNPAFVTKSANKEYILVNKRNGATRRSAILHFEWAAGEIAPTKALADLHLCKDGLPISQSPLFMGYDKLDSEFENRDFRMRNNFQIPGRQYWKATSAWGRDWSIPEDQLGDPATSSGFIFFGQPDFGTRTSTGYGNIKFISYAIPELNGFDFPVIRYPEVLLTYAEAIYERDGSISDADLDKSLNLVRERAGLPRLTNSFVGVNGLDMQFEIRRERTVEFAWEGFRFDDLRRWHTAHVELRKAVKGVKYLGTEFETNPNTQGQVGPFDVDGFLVLEEESTRLFDENKNYVFPIPFSQILLNPNLKQNPNY